MVIEIACDTPDSAAKKRAEEPGGSIEDSKFRQGNQDIEYQLSVLFGVSSVVFQVVLEPEFHTAVPARP